MWISPQYLFKGNLVDHTGMIKATLPIGKGDCAAAAKPCGDLRDSGRIVNQAVCCEHHIIVNIVTFQNSETSGAPWDIRECSLLGLDSDTFYIYHVAAVMVDNLRRLLLGINLSDKAIMDFDFPGVGFPV